MKHIFRITLPILLLCLMASCIDDPAVKMSTDELLNWPSFKGDQLEMTVNGQKVDGCYVNIYPAGDGSTDKVVISINAPGMNSTGIKLSAACTPIGENTMHLVCSEDMPNRCHYELDGIFTQIPAKGLTEAKANVKIDLKYTITSKLAGKTIEIDMTDSPLYVRQLPSGETTVNGETASKADVYTEALRLLNEDLANKYSAVRLTFGDDGNLGLYVKPTRDAQWQLKGNVSYWCAPDNNDAFTIRLNDQVQADIFDVWIRKTNSSNTGYYHWFYEYLTMQVVTNGNMMTLTPIDLNQREIIYSYQYYIHMDMGYYPNAKPSDKYLKLWPAEQTEYIEQLTSYLYNSVVYKNGIITPVWYIRGRVY